MQLFWICVSVALAVGLCLTAFLAWRLSARAGRLRHQVLMAEQASLQFCWAAWWARNAAEDPDPNWAEGLRRLSSVALCASSIGELRALIATASSAASLPASFGVAPPNMRNVAQNALAEMDQAELPWVKWQREVGGVAHSRALLEQGCRHLLGV